MELMKESDILASLKPEVKKRAREIMINAVLATDMSRHMQNLEVMK